MYSDTIATHARVPATVLELRKILDHRTAYAKEVAELKRMRDLEGRVGSRIAELRALLQSQS